MLRAYKYRIYPTNEQKALLAKTFGCCRFVYNWALNLKITAYKERKETLGNVYLTNLMKSELKAEHEWLSEVNSQSLQSALRNLDTAYTNFFRNTKAVGFPRFKSRKNKQSFLCPQHCRVDFEKGTITIPKAKDIPAVLHRKFKGMVKTVTISMTPSGRYFASVLVDTAIREIPVTPIQGDTALGIDLGIKSLAVCSDGRTFDNPKNFQKSLDRLKLLQKRLSRKQKDSANRNKARSRVARLQEHIANSRKDNLHKITHALTHDSQVRTICMENLNVKGMQRNHHLAQAVGDASFGTFLTLLEYKCRWYGVNLIKIDRFAPSSKTCGKCGYVYKGLKLSERSWTCPECGTHHDRDFNAACNIKEFGLKTLPTERGKVKPVDCPTVDERPRVLKSRGSKKQEKRGGIGISEAAKSLV
ncbi:RNA-guided endonuclease TnpB family protein [Prevotellamassilia timonensis]|uniref:RNA-guided endonuclease TnpB family protein n=1 Tax=Prevotellamassilia timonensis TaxID=1852370 RepID=UPI0037EAB84E